MLATEGGAVVQLSRIAAIHGLMWLATSAAAQPMPLPAAPEGVQVSQSYGIGFATVSSVNNPGIPYDTLLPGPFQSPVQLQGRGSVGYEYRYLFSSLQRHHPNICRVAPAG